MVTSAARFMLKRVTSHRRYLIDIPIANYKNSGAPRPAPEQVGDILKSVAVKFALLAVDTNDIKTMLSGIKTFLKQM